LIHDEFKALLEELRSQYKDKKILLGVERLDYIKAIPQKIAAFASFLEDNPNYIEKCVLIQVAIPTRSDVSKYKEQKAIVDELVGRVNGKYGTLKY
jgi:trehalose 6-phosphate synthase